MAIHSDYVHFINITNQIKSIQKTKIVLCLCVCSTVPTMIYGIGNALILYMEHGAN